MVGKQPDKIIQPDKLGFYAEGIAEQKGLEKRLSRRPVEKSQNNERLRQNQQVRQEFAGKKRAFQHG